MRVTITNTSKANQGVHTTGGLKFIPSGGSATFDVEPDIYERVQRLPFLTLSQDDEDAEPVERLWLALADDEHGAGFSLIDTGKRKFLGAIMSPTMPTEIEQYRFEPIERRPYRFEGHQPESEPSLEPVQSDAAPPHEAATETGPIAETYDAELLSAATDEELAQMHQDKFGKPPHHAAKRETIIAKLVAPVDDEA